MLDKREGSQSSLEGRQHRTFLIDSIGPQSAACRAAYLEPVGPSGDCASLCSVLQLRFSATAKDLTPKFLLFTLQP